MKRYYVVGVYSGVLYTLARNGSMWSNVTLDTSHAKEWRTLAGATRYIAREKSLGSEWNLAVLTVEAGK